VFSSSSRSRNENRVVAFHQVALLPTFTGASETGCECGLWRDREALTVRAGHVLALGGPGAYGPAAPAVVGSGTELVKAASDIEKK